MHTGVNARRLAVIAQNAVVWTWFVRSGHAGLIEDAMLIRAREALERRHIVGTGLKSSRECRRRGAARIRGYLAEHAQPVLRAASPG